MQETNIISWKQVFHYLHIQIDFSICFKNSNRSFWIPYPRHYNLRFVYFLPTFWKPKMFFQGCFFRKFCPYVWLVFKSGFWSRAGYSGACTVHKYPHYLVNKTEKSFSSIGWSINGGCYAIVAISNRSFLNQFWKINFWKLLQCGVDMKNYVTSYFRFVGLLAL